MGRSTNDFYETPAAMTDALLAEVPEIRTPGQIVFEPCAGRNAITDVLRGNGCSVVTNDIDRRMFEENDLDFCMDARDPSLWAEVGSVDWVVTNVPFSDAFEILVPAYAHCNVGVAMLLRVTFLEPTKKGRGAWLAENQEQLTDVLIFGSPRPSFTNDGTDWATTMWMVWRPNRSGAGTNLQFVREWQAGS